MGVPHPGTMNTEQGGVAEMTSEAPPENYTETELLSLALPSNYNEAVKKFAERFIEEGLNVVPVRHDSKMPYGRWRDYIDKKYPINKLMKFIEERKFPRIGIIAGAVSDNLIVIDFDEEKLFLKFMEALKNSNNELVIKLLSSWIVKSGKGYHVYLKIDTNDKQLLTTRKHYKNVDVIGSGAFVVAPPSFYKAPKSENETMKFYMFYGEITDDGFKVYGPKIAELQYESTQFKPTDFNEHIIKLNEDEYKQVLDILEKIVGKKNGGTKTSNNNDEENEKGFKQMNEKDIEELVEVLKQVYKEGQRHNLVLYLTGWSAKLRIHPFSALEVVKRLIDETGDEEPEDRLSALFSSYKKAHPNAEEVAQLEQKLIEMYESGELRRRPSLSVGDMEKSVKGASGIEELLGEEDKEVLEQIKKVLKKYASKPRRRFKSDKALPFKKTKQNEQYIVLDSDEKTVKLIKVSPETGEIIGEETILNCYPQEIYILDPPNYLQLIGSKLEDNKLVLPSYELKCVNRNGTYKAIGTAKEIKNKLNEAGLFATTNEGLKLATISHLFFKGLEYGIAKTKISIGKPGFHLHYENGEKRLIIEGIEVPERLDKEKLKRVLDLIEEAYERFFQHYDDIIPGISTFGLLINWIAVAPFHAILRHLYASFVPIVLLHGAADTGKTTLADFLLTLWSVSPRVPVHLKYVNIEDSLMLSSSDVATPARIERNVLSRTTLPVVLNDASILGQRYSSKNGSTASDVADILKNVADPRLIHTKYDAHQNERKYLSLPTIMMTMNEIPREIIDDEGVKRRTILFEFTTEHRPPKKRRKEYSDWYKEHVTDLIYFGQAVTYLVKRMFKDIILNFDTIGGVWETLSIGHKILEHLYKLTGKEMPEFLKSYIIDYDYYVSQMDEAERERFFGIAKFLWMTYFQAVRFDGSENELMNHLDEEEKMMLKVVINEFGLNRRAFEEVVRYYVGFKLNSNRYNGIEFNENAKNDKPFRIYINFIDESIKVFKEVFKNEKEKDLKVYFEEFMKYREYVERLGLKQLTKILITVGKNPNLEENEREIKYGMVGKRVNGKMIYKKAIQLSKLQLLRVITETILTNEPFILSEEKTKKSSSESTNTINENPSQFDSEHPPSPSSPPSPPPPQPSEPPPPSPREEG